MNDKFREFRDRSNGILTDSDREYAQRNGLSAEDMLEFKETVIIEEEQALMIREKELQQEEVDKQQQLKWKNFINELQQDEDEYNDVPTF